MPTRASAEPGGAAEARRFARNLWLGVLLLNLFVAGLSAHAIYSNWRSHVERARTTTQNMSMLLEREIVNVFDNVDSVLKRLVDDYRDMHASGQFAVERWNAELRRQRLRQSILSGIRGADAAGAVTYGLAPNELRGVSVADRDYFAAQRDDAHAGLLVSRPVHSRISDQWSLVLSRRLDDRGGNFDGIVAATIPLEHFGKRFAALKLGANGSIGMRDADLRLIVRSPEPAGGGDIGSARIAGEFSAALRADPAGGSYSVGAAGIDGVGRFHSYRRSDAYPFYIDVGVADDEYLSSWRREALQSAALACLFLLVTMVYALQLRRAWTLQRSATARLRRNEADFRILADCAPYGVALINADETTAYLNPAFTRVLGYRLEDIPDSATWWEKACPDPVYRKKLIDAWQRKVLAPASPGTLESFVSICRSDATQCDVRSLIVKMDDGRITVTFEDVTARKRAETALQESQDQFETVVEYSPLSMALVRMDGTIEYINRKAIETFGYLPQDIPTMDRWWQLAYPDDTYRREVVALWMGLVGEALVNRREIEPREYLVTCKDGGVKMTAIFGVCIADKVLVIFEDITGRKKTEERMQLARQIFDTASEAIFVSDLEGNLLDVNEEACRLAKYSREQMLRLRNIDIVAAEDIPRIAQDLARCDAGSVVENRWLLLCSDGSTVPLDLVIQRLPGDRYLAIGRDLTERERVLRQLAEALDAAESANRAKSRFLAAASHDLRQPIQAINLFCNALSCTALSGEQKQISDYLALSAKNLGDLLNALLDISKFDAGLVKPSPEVIRTAALLRHIDAEFSPIAAGKQLRFRFYRPPGEMALLTDIRLLHSLLGNLIGNAIKYTREGGILLGIRRRGDQALIQIWDSGIGIATEHMNSIFEEYFQIGNPQRDRELGLGLGLAIARRTARVLGTELICRSRPGSGSVFEFRLPLARELQVQGAEQTDQDAPGRVVASRLGARSIVVVEDDMAVASAIRLTLESQGMRVTTHDNAEDAMADPEITAADFYISDLRLPGLNGKEFLDALQQRSRKPIRAVILTGDTSPERIELAQSSRWSVLFKPIDLPTLLAAIEAQDSTT
jgi:PAS domain S-box-containing protein